MRTIALLTDFGTSDIYVGVMKGVIQKIYEAARFIDMTHDIQPQDVRQAAFALMNAYRYFVPGTIFLVVVDPGVGSSRRAVAVQAGEYFFVAPDNGVLAYVLSEQKSERIVSLTNATYQLPVMSQTFHGRDIFAPAAAYIARGIPLHELGEMVEDLTDFTLPNLEITAEGILGEVVHIDHFGNVITSIGVVRRLNQEMVELHPRFGKSSAVQTFRAKDVQISVAADSLNGLKRTYSEAQIGEPLLIVGSSGYVEIAVRQGNCASLLGVAIGDRIKMTIGGYGCSSL